MKFIEANEGKMKNSKGIFHLKIIFLVIACLAISSVRLYSQSIARVGSTAAPFLKIGVGARALAMGEAGTTTSEDVMGLYWNPAGSAKLDKLSASFNHFSYIADMYYDFGAFAMPIEGIGTIGLFVGNLGMPDIERTTIQFPDGNGELVSANSFVVGLNYARALTDRFAFGANVKYIKESIWNSSASSIAFDAGVEYKAFFKNIRIGMSISNFGTEMQMQGRDMMVQHDIATDVDGNNPNIIGHLDTESFPLPILFRVGISSNLAKDFFGIEQHDWTVAIDAVHPNDNKEYVNTGTEVKLFNILALRAGYRELFLADREGGLTYGFGIQYNVSGVDINFDYANVDYGRLDHHNKFSLTLSF